MVQTEVKTTGDNEHHVQVKLPKSEYNRIYAEQLSALSSSAKLPGFRPGKTPKHVIEKQFGSKLHEDTVSQLLQGHYTAAIESSGLIPAIQPALNIPEEQPEDFFVFDLHVVTWPDVELKPLSELSFDKTTVYVEESDVDSVIERLMDSQVSYEVEDAKVSELGDQVVIDFIGFVDDEAFEGGRGEDAPLVLGAGQFIPGFEEQLIGKKAGEHVVVNVTFPEPYQAAHLAGKDARFEVDVKSVGKAVKPDTEDKLAVLLGFDDAKALRQDAQARLEMEAADASLGATRDAALDALLASNEIKLSETMVATDMKGLTQRIINDMKQQGMEVSSDMFQDEAFLKEVREKSERGLRLSALIQAVRDVAAIDVSDEEVDVELARVSVQYPEEQREAFINWVKSDKEQMGNVRDRLLENKCVAYIVAEAKTVDIEKPLSVWQKERDEAQQAGTE